MAVKLTDFEQAFKKAYPKKEDEGYIPGIQYKPSIGDKIDAADTKAVQEAALEAFMAKFPGLKEAFGGGGDNPVKPGQFVSKGQLVNVEKGEIVPFKSKPEGFNIPLQYGPNNSAKISISGKAIADSVHKNKGKLGCCPRCGHKLTAFDQARDVFACLNDDCDFGAVITGLVLRMGKDLEDPANQLGPLYDEGMEYRPPEDGPEEFSSKETELPTIEGKPFEWDEEPQTNYNQMMQNSLGAQLGLAQLGSLMGGGNYLNPLEALKAEKEAFLKKQQQYMSPLDPQPPEQQKEYAMFIGKDGQEVGHAIWLDESASKQEWQEKVFESGIVDYSDALNFKQKYTKRRFKRTNLFGISGTLRARIWLESE